MPLLTVRWLAALVGSLAALAYLVASVDEATAGSAPTTTTAPAATSYDYDEAAPDALTASARILRSSIRLEDRSARTAPGRSERPRYADFLAAESETTLFRAVSSAERTDIESFGGFRQAPSGLSSEGKLFATTAEDAARYGRINYGLDQKPFHIVEARVPRSFAESLHSDIADRMRYVSVDPEQLGKFNQLAKIGMWDQVPWVAKP